MVLFSLFTFVYMDTYIFYFECNSIRWRWRLTNWRIAGNNSIQLASNRAKVLITKQQAEGGGPTNQPTGGPATASVFQLHWTNQARGRPAEKKTQEQPNTKNRKRKTKNRKQKAIKPSDRRKTERKPQDQTKPSCFQCGRKTYCARSRRTPTPPPTPTPILTLTLSHFSNPATHKGATLAQQKTCNKKASRKRREKQSLFESSCGCRWATGKDFEAILQQEINKQRSEMN